MKGSSEERALGSPASGVYGLKGDLGGTASFLAYDFRSDSASRVGLRLRAGGSERAGVGRVMMSTGAVSSVSEVGPVATGAVAAVAAPGNDDWVNENCNIIYI